MKRDELLSWPVLVLGVIFALGSALWLMGHNQDNHPIPAFLLVARDIRSVER